VGCQRAAPAASSDCGAMRGSTGASAPHDHVGGKAGPGAPAAPAAATAAAASDPPRRGGYRGAGLQLPQQQQQQPAFDPPGFGDAVLCSPTASIGGMAGFLGSPLPQLPLFQPSPRRAAAPGDSPSSRRAAGGPAAAASPVHSGSLLSNLFASPVRGGGNGGGAHNACGGRPGDAAALQFASDLLSTPCSRRGGGSAGPGSVGGGSGGGGDFTGGADLDVLMSSPPPQPRRTAGGDGGGAGGDGGGAGRRGGPRRLGSFDLLDLVGAPPVAVAAAVAASGAQGPLLSPSAARLSAGELDLLALLQGPQGELAQAAPTMVPVALPPPPAQPPRQPPRPLRRCLDLGPSPGPSPGRAAAATPAAAAAAADGAPPPPGGAPLLSTAAMAAAFAASLGGSPLPDQVLDPPSPHCHETLLPSPPSLQTSGGRRRGGGGGGGGGGILSGDEDEAVQIALQVAPLFASPSQPTEAQHAAAAARRTPFQRTPGSGKRAGAQPFGDGAYSEGRAAPPQQPGGAETVSAATLQRLVARGLDLAFPSSSGGEAGGSGTFGGDGGAGAGLAGGSYSPVTWGGREGDAPAAGAATGTPASRDPGLYAVAGVPFFGSTPNNATTPGTPAAPAPPM
jgi:hypothetical protein